MHFRLIKSGVLTFMTFTLFRGVFSDKICHYVAQLVKIASVCRLCGSSVAYSHHRHRVALFGKIKDSQERLASRISALLDIRLNCDDGSANLMCAKCKRRAESLEMAMMNLTKFKRSVAVLQSELSLHAIIEYPDKYTISTPNSDVT